MNIQKRPIIKTLLLRILCLWLLLNLGCNPPKNEATDQVLSIDTMMTEQSDNTSNTLITEKEDTFIDSVESFYMRNPRYKMRDSALVDTLEDHLDHWLFSIIERQRKRLLGLEDNNSKKKLARLPSDEDYELIKVIRQAQFYESNIKSNDAVLEKWEFINNDGAERWLVLLRDSLWSNQYTKPPRYQWVDGRTLYLVSTRSAAQWHEKKDALTSALSGKTLAQLTNLYDPFDIKHFKKWQGSAHSSPETNKSHLYAVIEGTHYSYYYFTKHRLSGADRQKTQSEFTSRDDFMITTSPHDTLSGEEQYHAIKETLVALQSGIKEPALNNLDLVGKKMDNVIGLYGSPSFENDSISVFGYANRVVVVKHNQSKVEKIRYMRLRDSFIALSESQEFINQQVLNL